jgi:hypothetical protein
MNMTATSDASLHDFITGKFAHADGQICVWLKRANTTKAFPIGALKNATAYIERASKSDDATSRSVPRQSNLLAASAEAPRASAR